LSEQKLAGYTFEDFRRGLKEDIKRTERLMKLCDELERRAKAALEDAQNYLKNLKEA
jgi:hypothetical protein